MFYTGDVAQPAGPHIRLRQDKGNILRLSTGSISFDLKIRYYYDNRPRNIFITKGRVKDKEIDKTSSKCQFDCKASGHICCQLSDGIQECRTEQNCPKVGMYQNSWNIDEVL